MTKYGIIKFDNSKVLRRNRIAVRAEQYFCIFDDVYRTQLSIGNKLKKTDKGIEVTYGFA